VAFAGKLQLNLLQQQLSKCREKQLGRITDNLEDRQFDAYSCSEG